MRVLVGHTSRIPELIENRPLPGRENRGDEYLSFGFSNPNLPYHKGMTWSEVCGLCPAGWKPDVYLHWSPEYNPVPRGIEAADCLTVGVFGDWNLGGQAIQAVGSSFDLLVADTIGAEHLRNLGFPNVIPALLWAYDPELHRCLPSSNRDIDVLMIGNFNHAVQQERSLWLARVARLAEMHKVVLTSGVYGEDYVRMMNRAKIVFNRSIRGEMNMRAYEAPACGALLFYERENGEIGQVLRDREDCVLYGEDDLEALLETYLAPENRTERERISKNGAQKIAQHSYGRHFASLLTRIEPHLHSRVTRAKNSNGIAQQWITTFEPALIQEWEHLHHDLMSSATPPKEQAQAWGLQGTRLAMEAWLLPACSQREQLLCAAFRCFQLALEQHPAHTLLRSNLGYTAMLLGDREGAKSAFMRCLDELGQGTFDADLWEAVLFPRLYDYGLVQMERARVLGAPYTTQGESELRRLLHSRIAITLSELTFQETEFSCSLEYARLALLDTPENPVVHSRIAIASRAIGKFEEALAHYHRLLELAPFEMKAWEDCAQLLLDLGRFGEAVSLLENLLAMLKGSPYYATNRSWAEKLRQQAQQMRTLPQPLRDLSCLLAFPDWDEDADWQEIIGHFAHLHRASDPALLLLRADPTTHANSAHILQQIHQYLTETLKLSPTNLPRITLLNSVLNSDDLWKVFHIANTCLVTRELPPLHLQLAQALGVELQPVGKMQAEVVISR